MGVMDNGKPPRVERHRKVDVAPQRDDPGRFENLLSQDEIEALRAKAREEAIKEVKDRQSQALYRTFLDEERVAVEPALAKVPIVLQLAPHAQYIMLDGTQYHTNEEYWVTSNVAAVLIEQANRGWAHEIETQVHDPKRPRRVLPPAGYGFANFFDGRQPRNLVTDSAGVSGHANALAATMYGGRG